MYEFSIKLATHNCPTHCVVLENASPGQQVIQASTESRVSNQRPSLLFTMPGRVALFWHSKSTECATSSESSKMQCYCGPPLVGIHSNFVIVSEPVLGAMESR